MKKLIFILLIFISALCYSQTVFNKGIVCGVNGTPIDSIILQDGALVHYEGSGTNYSKFFHGMEINGVYVDSIKKVDDEWIWYRGTSSSGKVGISFGMGIGQDDDVIDSLNVAGNEIDGVYIEGIYHSFKTFDYYVSFSSGNDDNTGTSPQGAWETVNKVNSSSFSPGDKIVFKKGDIWRETLTIPSSGTAGNHITFGSYGSGDKPKILGSVTDSTWDNRSGNIWATGTYDDPYNIGTEEAEILFIETDDSINWSRECSDNIADLDTLYDWYWQNDSIYIYCESDPGTYFSSVEIPQRERVIFVDDKEYVEINGLELAFAVKRTVQTEYPQSNTTGLTIEDCYVHHVGSPYLETGYHLAVCRNDLLIKDNDVSEAGRRNCSVHIYGASGITISNITYDGNYLHNGYHNTGTSSHISEGSNNHLKHIIIKNNKIYECDTDSFPGDRSETCPVRIEHVAPGNSIEDVKIYNNLFYYVQNHGLWLMNLDTVQVYNNTFYDINHNLPNPNNIFQMAVGDTCTQVMIKNNIFYQTGNYSYNPATYCLRVYANQDTAEIDMDYNLFYQSDNSSGVINLTDIKIYRPTNWDELNTDHPDWQDHDASIDNPDFTLIPDNLHLQTGSPAIDAGLAIPLIIDDYEGVERGDPPCIGAFETIED